MLSRARSVDRSRFCCASNSAPAPSICSPTRPRSRAPCPAARSIGSCASITRSTPEARWCDGSTSRGNARAARESRGPAGSCGERLLRDYIRVRHERDERQQHEQADGVHAGLDLRVWPPARHGFDPEKEQAPAVERGEREQIERAEVRAQDAEELKETPRSGPRPLRPLPDDAHRPTHLNLLFAGKYAGKATHVLVDDDRRCDDAHLCRFGDAHGIDVHRCSDVDEPLVLFPLRSGGHRLVQRLPVAREGQIDRFSRVRADRLAELLPVVNADSIHLEDAVAVLHACDLRRARSTTTRMLTSSRTSWPPTRNPKKKRTDA